MKKRTAIITLVLAGCLGVGAAYAGFGPRRHFHRGHGPLSQVIVQLDLTDAQRQQAAETLGRYRDTHRAEVDQVIGARQELFDRTNADVFNEAAVRDAFRRLAAVQEELAVTRAQAVSELRAILTPEQKDLLAEMQANMKERLEIRADAMRSIADSWLDRYAP
jgi:Spy/CpxP family protein refolding chaperone